MHSFKHKDATIHYQSIGERDAPVVLWGHGWGQSHQALMALAMSLTRIGRHILVDFPGFGNSPVPEDGGNWGSFEYAEAMAAREPYFLSHVAEIADAAMAEYARLTGRHYSRVATYRGDDADYLVVVQGSAMGSAAAPVDWLSKN